MTFFTFDDPDAAAERMAEQLDGERALGETFRGDDRLERCTVCGAADNRRCCEFGRELSPLPGSGEHQDRPFARSHFSLRAPVVTLGGAAGASGDTTKEAA